MLLAHDTEASLRSAVALVNNREEPQTLRTVEDLDAWYAEHGYTGRRDGDEAEVESLRALRPVLRELLTCDRDRAATLVNAMLAEARALPQLLRHDGLDWHIHAVPADAPLAQIGRASCRERVEISVGAVSLKKKNDNDGLLEVFEASVDSCQGTTSEG